MVSIIGAGNLAWHLAVELESSGVNVGEIYSRTPKNAAILTEYLFETEPVNSLDFSTSKARLFILAVSDNAIEEVAASIILPENSLLAHTSGAKSLATLNKARWLNPSINIGVFYPLMTFTAGLRVDFRKVPICIETENQLAQNQLNELAEMLSDHVKILNSEERLALHVSAVFACNFTNHLWALSSKILEAEALDFEMLKPLIKETYQKAMKAANIMDVQTGPAVRNDSETLQRHTAYLAEDEDLLKLYQAISFSIKDWHDIN